MTIRETMSERTTLSFEVFPPKTEEGVEKLKTVLHRLEPWHPDWVSCTCGAAGTDKGCQREVLQEVVSMGIPAVGHYTCVHRTREQIAADTDEFLEMGVDHVLALRGDYVPGEEGTKGDFAHATELMRFLKRRYGEKIHLACTGIPEGHIEQDDWNADIAYLKRKQDLGAELIVTQLTFDMEQFARWMDAVRAAGITLPVAAGVMPVLDKDKCLRHCLSVNGCAIPRSLARLISRYYNDPEGFREAGMDYSAAQILQYMAMGVNDLHIYTLNEWEAADTILTRCGAFDRD